MIGLTHSSGGSPPAHEQRPIRVLRGYTGPDIGSLPDTVQRYDLPTTSLAPGNIDQSMRVKGAPLAEEVDSLAGYDLQGVGGQDIHDEVGFGPKISGRVTRQEIPLDSHAGVEMKGTDYGQPNERGFRYRANNDGV